MSAADSSATPMRPGTRIDQDVIARDLRVSRLPVREALISLDQEGFVRGRPRDSTTKG